MPNDQLCKKKYIYRYLYMLLVTQKYDFDLCKDFVRKSETV